MAEAKEKTKELKVVTAQARQLRIAPRKIRLVTNLIKNMPVEQALAQLSHTHRKAAPMLLKLLKSAVANAQHNFSISPENLFVKSITADQGAVMKRYFPRARGSAFVIRRKISHVNLVLEERAGKAGKAGRNALLKKLTQAKKEEKAEVKPTETVGAEVKDTTTETKHTKTVKTNEQKKMNTVQQKRRMFTRKSGE